MNQKKIGEKEHGNVRSAILTNGELEGFKHRSDIVEGSQIHFVEGGDQEGEVVVLLAGFPQSWFAWRKVMPHLSKRFRVIAVDLPGQGDSARPASGYDTQTIAGMVHQFLVQQGVSRAYLAGHDIGAWVAFTFAAKFGSTLKGLALLDAGIPGVTLPDALPTAPERAIRTWHFGFHSIPDLPEILIEGKEREYVEWHLLRKSANLGTFSNEDIDEYARVFSANDGVKAALNFYRSVGLSAAQNKALCLDGKLTVPLLAVGADQGSIPDMAGPLRQFAENVTGATIKGSGHFIPEEQPAALAQELLSFFS
jgi:pimeloyl-ACP methyl ester carboxylesterase